MDKRQGRAHITLRISRGPLQHRHKERPGFCHAELSLFLQRRHGQHRERARRVQPVQPQRRQLPHSLHREQQGEQRGRALHKRHSRHASRHRTNVATCHGRGLPLAKHFLEET